MRVLSGIRVLDLSRILAGPFATMVLCDLGAEVIKVERPLFGDPARGNGPFMDGESSYFMSLNRGKKSITLDLKRDEGREVFIELVKRSDVLVENFVPGVMDRLGLGYEVLKEVNPSLIYCAISGFGQDGPYRTRPAFDIIVQALGGIMSITGHPDGPPVRPGVSYGDIVAGLFAVIGILSALEKRRRTGEGEFIDISMLDCQIAVLENAFMRYFATGEVPKPLGTRHPVYTPFQAFRTKDGWIVVAPAGGTSSDWELLCSAIDRVDLINDERFADGWKRTQNYDKLEPILSEAFLKKTTSEWLKILTDLGIPCAPVNRIDDAEKDPQVIHRGMIKKIKHPRIGEVKLIDSPIKFRGSECGIKGVAPALGEHTDEILKKLLGFPEDKIKTLRKKGVI